MIKVAVILANGCEELEALTPVDVLRRANVTVDTVSIADKKVCGSHKIEITADKLLGEINQQEYSALILPGGMPGAKNISENPVVVGWVRNFLKNGKIIGAICASPAVILAKHGLLEGYLATCYPANDFVDALGDNYAQIDVCESKNLITANGPKSAMAFALAICKALDVTARF